MKYEEGKCDICHENTKVVISENGFAKEMCASCIAASIDMEKAEEVRDLSVVLRIPFNIREYYAILMATNDKAAAMDQYLEFLTTTMQKGHDGSFNWDEIDLHYNAAKSHIIALAEITPLREAIENRGREKWGEDHTFQEIIRLEQIYENTIKQYNITSSLQQDAIRKAARLSVKMDNLIATNGFKELRDATAAQAQFLKVANIEELVATSDDETIRTVADLVSYLETNGFEFNKMLPNVQPDEIDFLMENYIKNVKEIIYNATGVEQQFKDFIERMKEESETKLMEEVAESMPLDDFDFDEFLDEEAERLDRELELEDWNLDIEDDEDYFH